MTDIHTKLIVSLNDQRKKYEDSTEIAEKLSAINLIVQIEAKLENPHREFELYRDIKQWIVLYLQNISNKACGYEDINFKKISSITKILNVHNQVKILKFTRKLLNKDHFDTEIINQLDELLINAEILSLDDEKNLSKKIIKKIILHSSKDLLSLFITCLMLIFIISIILLPAPFPFLETYSIKYVLYSENFYLNHFLNITAYMLDINMDEFEIKTTCVSGILFKIFGKVLFYLIIINFLIKEVTKRIIYK